MTRSSDQIAISDAELAPFMTGNGASGRAHGLLEQQKGVWELLRKGYDTLQTVRTKAFDFDGFQIKVQFNPGRITSTSAKVDAHSIRERKCFLCTGNLPPAQRGILHNGMYLVLCNPFPIFPEHFTISSLTHTPQVILGSFSTLLELTRQLGDRYLVFYNGPKCGASAPDHLHFQAGNRSFLPIDAEYAGLKKAHAVALRESASFRAYSVEKCLRRFIAFESSDAGLLERAFGVLHEALQNIAANGGEEPMMNVLGFHDGRQWRVLVFPRVKHRPAFYFKEGDAQLLISPAAVELGGICTTPRERDFEKVTREDIIQMYDEICVSSENFASIRAQLTSKLAAL
jgi:ATP adenylyltransferase/5',5'''-P-1,P-4-tetraphosphate phosphorylase II